MEQVSDPVSTVTDDVVVAGRMVDSGRAPDSPASLSAFTAFRWIAGIAVSAHRASSGMAKTFLAGMSCSVAHCISWLPALRKTITAVSDGSVGLCVRSGMVSG